jgi:hypothetical protein
LVSRQPASSQGNSENATSRATLRAEAMSRAVSSMVAVLVSEPEKGFVLRNPMQIGCQYGTDGIFRIFAAPLA